MKNRISFKNYETMSILENTLIEYIKLIGQK